MVSAFDIILCLGTFAAVLAVVGAAIYFINR